MGQAKYRLPFAGETLLRRICRIVGTEVSPILVIAAADQNISLEDLPPDNTLLNKVSGTVGVTAEHSTNLLPESSRHFFPAHQRLAIRIVRDDFPNSGPLAGIAQGLRHLDSVPGSPSAAFVTSCDAPFLKPALIRMLHSMLTAEFDAVVIRDERFSCPLCAVYRTGVARDAARLLAIGERRASALPESLCTRWVPIAEARSVDPELDSLVNCNTPEDYEWALQREQMTSSAE